MEEEYCIKASRTIAQVLECPICYDKMKKPKILPCQHTFCWKCLKKIADTTAQNISCAIFVGLYMTCLAFPLSMNMDCQTI